MKIQSIFLVLLLCVTLRFTPTSAESAASDKAIGATNCFVQKLSAFLDQITYFCNYVCTANIVNGEALPAAFEPFGPTWGFPVMNSVEAKSFFQIFYGRPDNGFVGFLRDIDSGSGFKGYIQQSNTTYRLLYPVDSTSGELVLSATPQNSSFVPTTRPWYTGAVASSTGIFVTSTPYVLTATSTLGINVSQRCKRNGTLELVSATAGLIDVITEEYITREECSQLDTENGAVAYVVNDLGILVLESDAILSSIITANQSSNAAIRAAANHANHNSFDVHSVHQGMFEHDDETWEIYSAPLKTSQEWNWAMVVIRPVDSSCPSSASSLERSVIPSGSWSLL